MQERFTAEHGCELFGDAFEYLLDGGGITDKRCRHLEASGRYIAYGDFNVTGYPFHEIS